MTAPAPDPDPGFDPASGSDPAADPAPARARRRSPFVAVVLALVAAFMLYLALPNIGPAVRAARADGTPGVFTAQRLDCVKHPGHESCRWSGDFQPDDGGDRRTDVALQGSDRNSLRAGAATPAIDTGRANRVYDPGGSNEWIFTAVLLAVALAIIGHLCLRPLSRRARERSRPRAPARAGGDRRG